MLGNVACTYGKFRMHYSAHEVFLSHPNAPSPASSFHKVTLSLLVLFLRLVRFVTDTLYYLFGVATNAPVSASPDCMRISLSLPDMEIFYLDLM